MVKRDKERFVAIDLLKAIAITLVIEFHFLYEIYKDNSLRPVGFIGVSLFFILSGYILTRSYPKHTSFSIKWFLKRFIKIASMYYLAIISILILFGKQTYSGNAMDIILNFLFLSPFSKSAEYSIISPAWFLTPLIGLYLLYPYLNKYVKNEKTFLLVIFLASALFRTIVGEWSSYSPIFFIAEFCFGIALAQNKKFASLAISFILLFVKPIMVAPFIIFFLIYHLKTTYMPTRILYFIGINTITFFLFHEALIKLIYHKWDIYGLNLTYSMIVVVLVSIIASVLSKKIQEYFNKI